MDENTIVYPHVFTWEQFQRALLYYIHYTNLLPFNPEAYSIITSALPPDN